MSATNFNMSLSKINKLAFRAARAHSGVLLYRECCCIESVVVEGVVVDLYHSPPTVLCY